MGPNTDMDTTMSDIYEYYPDLNTLLSGTQRESSNPRLCGICQDLWSAELTATMDASSMFNHDS
jgi:hypothetical protein